ncbi:class I SAM-dependent RNA methyltransferase [Novosphingobium umbonatum]|uniref:Class I SAM-dependent RNA methyltransferase n=1 Tax=Novosphingobium umbonatum TaxID=1908524 RepID=A0A3S2VCG9_9SPHN|nr:class I SAM-dependent RNA methyltransferase [Novosphingobium umbonatum]RVU04436.1 class I SAM-dependent RNA methyltransferase [Novosphingobium umbonatum]
MSEETIIRLAAKGDGVTASGGFVAGAAPGDVLLADGSLRRGAHYAAPACRHYGQCGGCQLQHVDDAALGDFVFERVSYAASGQGVEAGKVTPAHLSPAASRRRASLHAQRVGGAVAIGFREAGSHKLVDLQECPVLVPELAALLGPLRRMLSRRDGRLAVEIDLTLAEQGVDVSIKGLTVEGLQQTEAMLDFARDNKLARLSLDQGFGPESLWEPDGVSVNLSGVSVPLPPGAFLQATLDGEQALVGAAVEWLKGVSPVADLFSGLGTFAYGLAKAGAKVLAAEADQAAHLACKSAAARSGLVVHSIHRDLFRNPLLPDELNRFGGVVLDPPRAGARDQVGRVAASTVKHVVYISCNPSSWARDAATLVAGGYRLVELRPVGQFRWSTHVELASYFTRD